MISLSRILPVLQIPMTLPDISFQHLKSDSRHAGPQDLFVAIGGKQFSPETLIAKALQAGLPAIITEGPTPMAVQQGQSLVLYTPALQDKLTALCTLFYPQMPPNRIATTGTNGKTSISHFLYQLWHAQGHRAASIGTLGVIASQPLDPTLPPVTLTAPPLMTLRAILHGCAQAGISHVAFEATSHALIQQRLKDIMVQGAIFTNLAQDHLDYHHTMQAYLEAKKRLFSHHTQPDGFAILNTSLPQLSALQQFCRTHHLRPFTYGPQNADGTYTLLSQSPTGYEVRFQIHGHEWESFVPLLGQFQVENLLGALMGYYHSGGDMDQAMAYLPQLSPIPARLERVGILPMGGEVIVDFAHTPDGLQKTLAYLRDYTKGRLGVVFGCGGDRDKEKRPLMGKIAAAYADWVIVTDDNPRSEPPEQIRRDILQGCPQAKECFPREKAIAQGMGCLQPGDTLVIAGKGHETIQILADKTIPFCDKTWVQHFITTELRHES